MKQIDRKSKEPILVPGAGKRIAMWLVGIAIVLAVTVALSPLASLGHWLSCTYITGSCL